MTSTVMLAALRTILDEASASFWTDAECYAALADGQNEVIRELLTRYRMQKKVDSNAVPSYELQSILNDDTGTAQTLSVPAGFLELYSATFDHDGSGGEERCRILELNEVKDREDNTYLSATGEDPSVYVKSVSDTVKIVFLPTLSGTPAYTVHFFKSPADIASGQNATLPVTTHSAIVHYAAYRMLAKDDDAMSGQEYNLYLKELEKF